MKNLIENTDYLTLTAVLRYDRNRKDDFRGRTVQQQKYFSEVLEYGTSEVFILLLRVEYGQDERGNFHGEQRVSQTRSFTPQ